jgi:hypothetical protein
MKITIDAGAVDEVVVKSLQDWLVHATEGELSKKERKAMLRVLSLYMPHLEYVEWLNEEGIE